MIEEKFISGPSIIHQLAPKTRILGAAAVSVAAALCDHVGLISIYLCMAVSFIWLAQLKPKDIFPRIKPLFWFLLMIWVVLPITFEGKIVYEYSILKISEPGIVMCAKITLKSITILLVFTSLIATMTIASLGAGLHQLNMPDKLVFLLLMTYRYIAVIQEEYHRLLRAAKFRGFKPGTNLHSYKTFAYLAGMLFVRASIRAKRVHQAMLCRGFNQKFHSLDVYMPNRLNSVFLIGICMASFILVMLEVVWM